MGFDLCHVSQRLPRSVRTFAATSGETQPTSLRTPGAARPQEEVLRCWHSQSPSLGVIWRGWQDRGGTSPWRTALKDAHPVHSAKSVMTPRAGAAVKRQGCSQGLILWQRCFALLLKPEKSRDGFGDVALSPRHRGFVSASRPSDDSHFTPCTHWTDPRGNQQQRRTSKQSRTGDGLGTIMWRSAPGLLPDPLGTALPAAGWAEPRG